MRCIEGGGQIPVNARKISQLNWSQAKEYTFSIGKLGMLRRMVKPRNHVGLTVNATYPSAPGELTIYPPKHPQEQMEATRQTHE